MLDKIKERLITGLACGAYNLERLDMKGCGQSNEREQYAYAENDIMTYSQLLKEFFPEVDVKLVEADAIAKFKANYEENPDDC